MERIPAVELAYSRAIFDAYGRYESDPQTITVMLEQAVTDMQARVAVLAGKQRDHMASVEHPFVVVLVDGAAFLRSTCSRRHGESPSTRTQCRR